MTAGQPAQRKILVFGKTGQVATELCRLAPVIALGRNKADLSKPEVCADAIHNLRPDVVINAAAYTAVDHAEKDQDIAQRVNGDSPRIMAQACAACDIPFLHVSTDYVFDGHGHHPWKEDHAVNPLNAYGRTKLNGELGIRSAGGRHAILRTSWVFSAHGANFVKTMLRLSETHRELSIVNDQIGGPTPAQDIAKTLLSIADGLCKGKAGGTYHYNGQPEVSWADFVRCIFKMSGQEIGVHSIPTTDYPTPAKRPLNSRLDCAKLETEFGIKCPDWKVGLSSVLVELKREKV